MSKKKQEEEKLPETASELREYLNKKNSQARAARRALKVAEERELVSAKTDLGEAVAGAVFADNTDAILALVQVVNKPEIADALRRVVGVKNTPNDALGEPGEDPPGGGDGGGQPPGSHDAYASF